MKMYHWKTLVAERELQARLAKGEPAPDAPDVKVNVPKINRAAEAKAKVEAQAATATAALIAAERRVTLPAAIPVTTQGRKICVECAHYSQRECTNRRARSPVMGTSVEATSARREKWSCGPDGRYFEPRMAVPPKPRERDDSEPMQYVPPVPFRRLEVFRDEVVAVLYPPAQLPAPTPFLMLREHRA